VQIVRNPWYYGSGIHLTPYGWLYNISGFDTVQITMSGGKSFKIGTDEPVGLEKAITQKRSMVANFAV